MRSKAAYPPPRFEQKLIKQEDLKGLWPGAAARRFLAIFIKIGFFENLVKIGFWDGFGSIWAPESDSA